MTVRGCCRTNHRLNMTVGPQPGLLPLMRPPIDDGDVVNAIARVTGGNFRLVERLFAQIQRVVQINELPSVTTEVVAVAGEGLVIGSV